MKLISHTRRMFYPNSAFILFLNEAIKYYTVRKKECPKMSDKKDILKFISSLWGMQDLVYEGIYSHYNKNYYKFQYKGETIYIW